MDGTGRYPDIIFVEWLRWTVKHEEGVPDSLR